MTKLVLLFMTVLMCASFAIAQDAAKPQISVKTDLELYYELSKDVGGPTDGDKFETTQLYLIIDGKFDKGMESRLMLDGADIVASEGKVVTEKIVEEANFTAKQVGGSPVTLVFGKDEMPFGLDFDKHLNDSIAHQFEVDKVWGLHGIYGIEQVGELAAAAYQHRHTLKTGETLLDADNELGNNYAASLTVDKPVDGLKLIISGAKEAYGNRELTEIDDETGLPTTTTVAKDDETRMGAGLVFTCPMSDVTLNAEYITFSNMGGKPDYDPGLITLGAEYPALEQVVVWGRYEMIQEDAAESVETDFWTVGVAYSPVKELTLSMEYSNFNSINMAAAKSLTVPDGSLENAVLVGARAKF